ncbi:hypothetical protein Poly30_01690 [Planctomycetes bacterium Poly30]|uniref:Uncharacterized protein n=1 Tax=Saltatorellus ferox TaxID=2528018 RepID=A0A518EKR1_9BACT|nr:hypothetical protein Poly30_01690 [Planctomycetes bacterium Poly30]
MPTPPRTIHSKTDSVGKKPGIPGQGEQEPGTELRARVERLGTGLAESLAALVANVPGRPSGPQALGRALGMTTVTASRLLKALSQPDPIAVLQLLPGPNPLRKMVESAAEVGTPGEYCEAAEIQVTAFDHLIRDEAGDRGSLRAMLSAWLPEERREFEGQRRQTIFKALNELEGVACEFELASMLLFPGKKKENLDIVSVKCLLGIDRIRPDAPVKLETRRLADIDLAPGENSPRVPLNLDGEPALDGLHTVRLDDFCNAPPAPLVARQFGNQVEYSLGPTGFGRGSKVDLVIAEVNRSEPVHRKPSTVRPPYFFMLPEMPTRRAVFDLFVHRDVFEGSTPSVLSYNTSSLGPSAACDPARHLDQRDCPEPMQHLGTGIHRVRMLEFPRYTMLLEHVGEKLGWNLDEFSVYRIAMSYPLVGRQLTLAFLNGAAADS